MRKIIIIYIFILVSQIGLAQSKDLGFEVETYNIVESKWGAWESFDCFDKISFRVRYSISVTNKRRWFIEIKNNTSENIEFNYCLGNENDYLKSNNWNLITRIKKGESTKEEPSYSDEDNTSQDKFEGKIYVAIGGLRYIDNNGNFKNEKFEYCDDIIKGNNDNILCAYCKSESTNGGNPFCKNGKFYKSDWNYEYSIMAFAGDILSDEELEKKKKEKKAKEDYEKSKYGISDKNFEKNTTKSIDLMKSLSSGNSNKFAFLNGNIGLGYEHLPIYANSNIFATSSAESSNSPIFYGGLELGLFNNKPVSIRIQPYAIKGFNFLSAFSPGIDLNNLTLGVTTTLWFATKTNSKFKIFVEQGYFKRNGEWSLNVDDQNRANGTTTATGEILNSSFDYSVLRFGGGFLICWGNSEQKSYLRPGFFLEKLNNNEDVQIKNVNLQWHIESQLTLELNYAIDYPYIGTNNYPVSEKTGNQYSIRLIKHFNFLKIFSNKK